MNQESFEKRIEELNKLVAASKRIVFFSGAGVSTESGIPDFRSGKYGIAVPADQIDPQAQAFIFFMVPVFCRCRGDDLADPFIE